MSGAPALRASGPLSSLDAATRAALLERASSTADDVGPTVTGILARVAREGDTALRQLARELDGVTLAALEVPRERLAQALATLDPRVRGALRRSAHALRRAHSAERPGTVTCRPERGIRLARRPAPLARVGVYAPGGRAAYASSVLMGAIPARVAGVAEVVLCSPPGADGLPSPAVLAAAALAGVDRVFAIGGAGAIAALAFGTATVPRVDRVVGPGNAWVLEAKRQVSSRVGVDLPAGPSELVVIADAAADLAAVARELVAQAEHDPHAAVLALLLPGGDAGRLITALGEALHGLPLRAVAEQALAARGAVLSVADIAEALGFVEAYAPEHLVIATRDATRIATRVRNAGTVFAGTTTSCVFGDYRTGGNHVLPTGGSGRWASGLSTLDFVRWTTIQQVSARAARQLGRDGATLARAEGLEGHARAAEAAGHAAARVDANASRAMVALDDNTNPFGAAPSALRLARTARSGALRRYPTERADELRQAIAAHAGGEPANVVTGAGADDVLDLAFRALAGRFGSIAFPDPTFSMVAKLAGDAGIATHPVARDARGAVSMEALLATGARLLYLASPDNPTGLATPRDAIELALARGVTVILDEAYAEFDGPGWLPDAAGRQRLLVVRTFSKAYGLAGLRVGYGVGARELIEPIERLRPPYRIGRLAERAAARALCDDQAWMLTRVERIVRLRERLLHDLRQLGFDPLPSRANFVLVPLASLGPALDALESAGVRPRAFPALTGIGSALRISIAPWPVLARALRALGPFAPTGRRATRVGQGVA